MKRVTVLLLPAGMVAPGCSRPEGAPRDSPWPLQEEILVENGIRQACSPDLQDVWPAGK